MRHQKPKQVSDKFKAAKSKQKVNAPELFFVCRVLASKPKREFVIFRGSELPRRRDVEVTAKGFATESEANAAISRSAGFIPTNPDMFLHFYAGEAWTTLWNWKDLRTQGASQ